MQEALKKYCGTCQLVNDCRMESDGRKTRLRNSPPKVRGPQSLRGCSRGKLWPCLWRGAKVARGDGRANQDQRCNSGGNNSSSSLCWRRVASRISHLMLGVAGCGSVWVWGVGCRRRVLRVLDLVVSGRAQSKYNFFGVRSALIIAMYVCRS